MARPIAATFVMIAILVISSSRVEAQRRFGGGLFRRAAAPQFEDIETVQPQPAAPQAMVPQPSRHLYIESPSNYGHAYDYYRAMWPRYFGGFHERHWSTYGRTYGEIGRGLRGTAW